MDGAQGTRLWQLVREAGKAWDIGPGNPNPLRTHRKRPALLRRRHRRANKPLRSAAGRYVDLQVEDDGVGIGALRHIAAEGPRRRQMGVILDGDVAAGPRFELPFI
jgi:aminomethyltransferase